MKLSETTQKLQQNPEYAQAMDDLALHFELANAVLRARLRKGWTQTYLAKKVGTKQANISKIETGLANPTLSLVRKLSQALDLDILLLEKHPETDIPYSITVVSASVQTITAGIYQPASDYQPAFKMISDASMEREGYKV